MKVPLNAAVGTRITKPLRREFIRKAKKEMGLGQSDVLRLLIQSYVAGNIVLSLPPK